MNNRALDTVLITGAAGGIGRSIALRLAQTDYHVVLNYRRAEESAQLLASEIVQQGGSVTLARADITDEDNRNELIAQLPSPLFGFVHAAVAPLEEKRFLRTDPRSFLDHWKLAVDAPAALLRAVLPAMLEARRGSAIFLLSTSVLASPPKEMSAYVSAKMAAWGLMRCLAIEYAGRGVRFNAVSPGFTETDLTAATPAPIKDLYRKSIPMGRFGEPKDVADSVAFLLSEQARFITGINLPVAGGSGIL